jgi:hypothetical protein
MWWEGLCRRVAVTRVHPSPLRAGPQQRRRRPAASAPCPCVMGLGAHRPWHHEGPPSAGRTAAHHVHRILAVAARPAQVHRRQWLARARDGRGCSLQACASCTKSLSLTYTHTHTLPPPQKVNWDVRSECPLGRCLVVPGICLEAAWKLPGNCLESNIRYWPPTGNTRVT